MKEKMFEMECPWCGHSFFIKRDTWLNADARTDELVASGAYFRHRCSKCHNVFEMFHPFVYRNQKHHYILLLSQMETPPRFTEERQVVVCRNPADFSEAARILNRDQDLTAIIALRNEVRGRTGRSGLRFEDCQGDVYWFHDEGGSLGVRHSWDTK